MLDFNRANLSASNVNSAINALLDNAALAEPKRRERGYLGASLVGDWCLRKIQYTWMCDSNHPARTKRIFARGHLFEEISAEALARAGFRMERGTPATAFEAVGGRFRGHADGIIIDGPAIGGLGYPCLWEHKALGETGWNKLEKYGIEKAYPQYYAQVQVYLAYLGLDANPALFTAVNANTCEALHILVPFDAEAAQATSDRAVTVLKATEAGELLDRVADSKDNWRCKMCNHKERCWNES